MNLSIIESITYHMLTHKINNLSKTKWLKIVFFIDLCYYNCPISDNNLLTGFDYIKMPYGPMIDDYENILEHLVNIGLIKLIKYVGYSSSDITYMEKCNDFNLDFECLNRDAIMIINKICDTFKGSAAKQLSELSHALAPWKQSNMFDILDFSLSKRDEFLINNVKKTNLYNYFF